MFSVFNMWVFKGSLLALMSKASGKTKECAEASLFITYLTPFVVDLITKFMKKIASLAFGSFLIALWFLLLLRNFVFCFSLVCFPCQ